MVLGYFNHFLIQAVTLINNPVSKPTMTIVIVRVLSLLQKCYKSIITCAMKYVRSFLTKIKSNQIYFFALILPTSFFSPFITFWRAAYGVSAVDPVQTCLFLFQTNVPVVGFSWFASVQTNWLLNYPPATAITVDSGRCAEMEKQATEWLA